MSTSLRLATTNKLFFSLIKDNYYKNKLNILTFWSDKGRCNNNDTIVDVIHMALQIL